ncbi:ABC transporter permease [Chitinibacter sp. ZOR0017]|uniref:ABC transporter permease n=1 Tax=Chitinibacter sp. ZOR0017 TaxID=1339254 RepID=UPI000646A7B8|nr:ABC transporter permease [Chitinibacter sp. ZOR0017]
MAKPSAADTTIAESLQLRAGGYAISGELTLHSTSRLWPACRAIDWQGQTLDLAAVTRVDGAGAALLFELSQAGAQLQHLSADGQRLLQALNPSQPLHIPAPAGELPLISRLGRASSLWLNDLAEQISFIGEAAAAFALTLRRPQLLRRAELWRQCEQVGANALPIISLIAFLLGIILAFQSAIPMRQFGAEVFVANLLGLSVLRELGPLMTAIVLAGRTGAAFAAEIGTMKVNEEINALVTFGYRPMNFLVLPRLLAGALMLPLLAIWASVIALLGGAIVLQGFGIPLPTFWTQLSGQVAPLDILTGLIKAVAFGLVVASVGCLRGLSTGNGASAVGASTTRAVVQILVLLVVTDGLFAVVFYHLGW